MLTWLADVLRDAGLAVVEIPGWGSRGHGEINTGDILGVLLHHTAGPAAGSYPSLPVVRDGRPGLAGPLANLGLARDGTWYVIAAGVAWHAGAGSIPWCPTDQGNQHLIGVEAESTGILVGGRADWTPAQLNSYPRGVAALLNHLNLPAARAIGHKEWAPTRKIDPAGIDMAAFRLQTAALMTATAPEADVPLTPADAELVAKATVKALLAAPLRDLYPDKPFRDITVGETLQWAAANAGRALDAARRTGTTGGDPAAFATAVAVELAARLKEK